MWHEVLTLHLIEIDNVQAQPILVRLARVHRHLLKLHVLQIVNAGVGSSDGEFPSSADIIREFLHEGFVVIVHRWMQLRDIQHQILVRVIRHNQFQLLRVQAASDGTWGGGRSSWAACVAGEVDCYILVSIGFGGTG